MKRRLGEIFEDEDHIELLQAELNTLQRGDLNLGQGDDQERRIREVYKALRCGLETDVLANRDTLE